MSYENWVKNSWLDKQSSDREEIGRLLGIADARLDDYRKAVKGKLSTDVQLGLAYDAARASATASKSLCVATRCHLSDKNSRGKVQNVRGDSSAIHPRSGSRIQSLPRLGGLHHRYAVAASISGAARQQTLPLFSSS